MPTNVQLKTCSGENGDYSRGHHRRLPRQGAKAKSMTTSAMNEAALTLRGCLDPILYRWNEVNDAIRACPKAGLVGETIRSTGFDGHAARSDDAGQPYA
ncbi:hypothetical protein PspLS_08620 [Pyricularia sp. CBS 133598]|nr:hypothetical protein PspLS_08620 [Pyricularia sp. CBS 133598]